MKKFFKDLWYKWTETIVLNEPNKVLNLFINVSSISILSFGIMVFPVGAFKFIKMVFGDLF